MKRILATAMVAMAATFGPLMAQAQRCDLDPDGACVSASASPLFSFARADDSPQSPSTAPEPGAAWLMALGFLGFVVLRRTRSGPMM
jgi:hypothetical protein